MCLQDNLSPAPDRASLSFHKSHLFCCHTSHLPSPEYAPASPPVILVLVGVGSAPRPLNLRRLHSPAPSAAQPSLRHPPLGWASPPFPHSRLPCSNTVPHPYEDLIPPRWEGATEDRGLSTAPDSSEGHVPSHGCILLLCWARSSSRGLARSCPGARPPSMGPHLYPRS